MERVNIMKIEKIEHIGIAVKSIKDAMKFYGDILNLGLSEIVDVPSRKLRIAFIELSGTKLELLESIGEGSVIDKFIQKKGEGIHHISFEVDDIEAELSALKSRGVQLINEKPYLNAHKNLVAFINPRSTRGVLVELIQTMNKKKE